LPLGIFFNSRPRNLFSGDKKSAMDATATVLTACVLHCRLDFVEKRIQRDQQFGTGVLELVFKLPGLEQGADTGQHAAGFLNGDDGAVVSRDVGQVDPHDVTGDQSALFDKMGEAVGESIELMVGDAPAHVIHGRSGRDIGRGSRGKPRHRIYQQ
jgi:hypothetical protein